MSTSSTFLPILANGQMGKECGPGWLDCWLAYGNVDKNNRPHYNLNHEHNEKEKKDDRLHSKHDGTFKYFLTKIEVAQSFFEENLPKSITSLMDFKTLKISKDTFVDKKISQYLSDILYEIKLQGKTVWVYLLIDHKSKKDRLTGFQLLKYMVRIWDLHLKQHKKARLLQPIIPMVVYHGERFIIVTERIIAYFNGFGSIKQPQGD